MSPPSAVDILPRHLQQPNSASSSSNASPAGTPPTSTATAQPSAARSPAAAPAPLPSPGLGGSTSGTNPSAVPPGSPSSSNRFGLNLGFIQRRPRGWTVSSAPRSPGRSSPAQSPSAELPPSPGGSERPSSGYGFPALRRTLSKRASSHGGEQARPRMRRSSSQPPAPNGLVTGGGGDASGGSGSESRPGTGASAAAPVASTSASGQGQQAPPTQPQQQQAQPGFSALTTTTSLPNPPNRSSSLQPSRSGTGDGSSGPSSAVEPTTTHKLRLVPHLESSRSLHFEPIERDLAPSALVRVGRFTDRHGGANNSHRGTATDPARVAFKSKVVSRGHAEIWVDDAGKFFIRDTKSSSGTFLNHIRLSGPNIESRPFNLKDGDVLQLGVDYQGGTEEIYRCVKMRVELNRGWQRGANSFNTAALAQLRALGGGGATPSSSALEATPTSGTAMTAVPSTSSSTPAPPPGSAGESSTATPKPAPSGPTAAQVQAQAQAASITDCCICLYPVTVCQALFIAPCSHVTHFKCIRPLVEQNYPGFCCPLCRTYANLEADVEIDLPEPEPTPLIADTPLPSDSPSALGLSGVSREPDMDPLEEVDEPASRAPSIRAGPRPTGSRRSSVAALTQALSEANRRASSRPGSIAPQAEEEEDEGVVALAEGDEAGVSSSTAGGIAPPVPHISSSSPSSPPSPSSSSAGALAMPMALSASPSSHLAPPSDDLYASLANAATPPNNTFLSTLAESGASSLPFFRPSVPATRAAVADGPTASGTPGMGSLLDAAMQLNAPSTSEAGAAVAVSAGKGPSTTSLGTTTGTTNSGGSANDADEDGEGEGDAEGDVEGAGDDAATAEEGSSEGAAEAGGSAAPASPAVTSAGEAAEAEQAEGAGKGKGKEREVAEAPSSPPPATAAALTAKSPKPKEKEKKGKAPIDEEHTDPALLATSLLF
ncbi:hypothetical protein JCM8097_007910 [Rhodosporidiobolus ruineniae]